MNIRTLPAFALLLAAFLAPGCGDRAPVLLPIHPTSGRLLTADGKPAAGAMVSFFPVDRAEKLAFTPHATTGEDGTFQLTSTAAGDGAPEGDYAVAVMWPTKGSHGDLFGPDRLQGKYADPKNPLCRATVRAGENRLDPFQLK